MGKEIFLFFGDFHAWRIESCLTTHMIVLMIYIGKWSIGCELSLDPEVAILFGREIGQSNDGILLTDCWNLQG